MPRRPDMDAERARFERVLLDYDYPHPVRFERARLGYPEPYSHIGEWSLMPRAHPTFEERPVGGKMPMIVRVTRSALLAAIRMEGIDVPSNAKITFHVPDGGDYSNTEVELDDTDQVISVRYEK